MFHLNNQKKTYDNQNLSPPGVKTRQMRSKLLKSKRRIDKVSISGTDTKHGNKDVNSKKHIPVEDEDMSFRGWSV